MIADRINDPLSKYTARLLKTYLKLPEDKPITAVDFACEDGTFLNALTSGISGRAMFGVCDIRADSDRAEGDNGFVKACAADVKSQSKITNDVFSLAVVNPYVDDRFMNDLFDGYDPFQVPNFEVEERRRILSIEQQKKELEIDLFTQPEVTVELPVFGPVLPPIYGPVLPPEVSELDFGMDGITDEQRFKQWQEIEAKVKKAIEDRQVLYRRMLREQEKRTESYRNDKFMLAMVTKYLAPRGILIFITPKEFIDSQICFKLVNNYEDIQIVRLDDDEYQDYRKCIIIARKRQRVERGDDLAYELMTYKTKPFQDIPVLEPQLEPKYIVPSKKREDVQHFRVGSITKEEVLQIMKRATTVSTYVKNHGLNLHNEVPKPPTQLHKGHIGLLLSSGLLNGYIGTGPDEHLVKGSVVKLSTETEVVEELPDGREETRNVEKEYFHIGIKYLDRNGRFHKLL